MSLRPGISISAQHARRLLMSAQQLLQDPNRRGRGGAAGVYSVIHAMGFVQLDTISAVERAHHHILHSRLNAYRPAQLETLHQDKRVLFEHITHDVSLIPTEWFAHWRYRHARAGSNAWLRSRLGTDAEQLVDQVRRHVKDHGPCMSRDVGPRKENKRAVRAGGGDDASVAVASTSAGWWEWKPHKAALEYLWRTGELCVCSRESFNKVYDLTRRVLPEAHAKETPGEAEHVDWACRSAMDRLGIATAGELCAFWKIIKPAQAADWCRKALGKGELVPVMVESQDGSPARSAYAWHDIRSRVKKLAEPPDCTRLLSPFDPVIRDRNRLKRLFNFDYRLEVFVPAAKRTYGYYVLPILEGDRLVGRLDPKLHRDKGELEIKRVWLEPGIRLTKGRRSALADAVERYALFAGASRWTIPKGF
ncbi:MAG: YcaQ family DNA glycosylase [Pyrinomonadaceae bacterium]|nr:YcaQ family DNA glycosylase [Phycisphaerales bacterium]